MQTRLLLRVIGVATGLLIVIYLLQTFSLFEGSGRKISGLASSLRGGNSAHTPEYSSPETELLEDHVIVADEPSSEPAELPTSPPEPQVKVEDKIVVIGRLEKENTDWVHEHLPEWQNAIYTVDNTSAAVHTPRNKGREANVYLHYIIQNYHNLPSTIAFLHAHRDGWPTGWHNDAPGYDNVIALQTLRTDFVQQNGYANLRCNWVPGCPDEVQWKRPSEPGADETENVEHNMVDVWHHFFGNDSAVPEVIATQCCAQFAVSRAEVLRRPLADYQKYHQWLMDTPLSDQTSGTIFEYLWHVIFGQTPVYCPEMTQCYSDVYGRGRH